MSSENMADVAFEAATNKRYRQALARKLTRRVEIAMSANEKWVENTPKTGLSLDGLGPLVARVALDVDDEFLGTAFYIGARFLADFDHPVVSWDAPVARIFYAPQANGHNLGSHVLLRRALLERGNEIVKVFDEWTPGVPRTSTPFQVKALAVPFAPAAPQRRRSSPEAPSVQSSPEPPRTPAVATPGPPDSDATSSAPDAVRGGDVLHAGMRSVEAVKYALGAPRTDALTSVLATLQPDQYDLVTRPGNEPLLVQGHPGTGKTIIALHRAAYLVSTVRSAPDRVARLLILGPTDEYVRHISGILKTLDVGQRVTVKAIPTWLVELAKLEYPLAGELDSTVLDAGKFIKGVTDQAARLCKAEAAWATGTGARLKNLERIYDVIRRGGTGTERLKLGPYSREWIKTLPVFAAAVKQRRYARMFAQASLSILGGPTTPYDHVIVDEAQDVVGLEWEIIRAHNPTHRWTLVGDMNQRRTDFGDSTWERLADRLALESDNGAVKPVVIERGYRSTQAILDFAKPLLALADRRARSLQQDGPPVKVIFSPKAGERDNTAIAEGERLLSIYEDGTVAIITTDRPVLEKALLAKGWRRGDRPSDFTKDGRVLAVRTPEAARGIEFDGVVVVEPGSFPQNLGRDGQLYTSLTRANRELAVVHHDKLPDKLRRHGRR